jgi:hypothetical protein
VGSDKISFFTWPEVDIVAYRQNENPEFARTEIKKYAKFFVLDVQTGNSIFGA